MAVDRIDRVNELLRREIGEMLFPLLDGKDVDVSAFTVTRVITSRNLRHARVMISIRDHHDERPRLMDMIKSLRKVMQTQINHDLVLKYTPRLTFELDESVEKGDNVLDILAHLDEELPSNDEGDKTDG